MTDYKNLSGDCLEVLPSISERLASLVMTSPPYADARKDSYGGPHPDEFVEWILPRIDQIQKVLKEDGTFILNIKEKVCNGERHTYVIDLIRAMRERGWLWTEEWIWHKKNCHPGKWPNRFRDAWERCIQFNLSRHFKMRQDSVMVPIGSWAEGRMSRLSEKDKVRDPSASGSGFGKNVSNWKGRDMVYPTNVLHMATECGNRNHPAAFPEKLPEFFIKLFTDEGDLVIDPFEGSGTTGVVSVRLGRRYVGIDKDHKSSNMAAERIGKYVGKADALKM